MTRLVGQLKESPMLSETLKALIAAGASPEQLLAVVEIHEKQQAENQEKLREKWRSDKRRQRMMSTNVHETTVDSTGHQWTPKDLSSPLNGSLPANRYNINTPLSLNTPSLNTSFADFWSSYPRKVGKGAALKAYKKALTKTDAETILKAVNGYQWSAEKEFIPHPATWLNGERWADETTSTGEPKPDPTRKALHEMTDEERTRALDEYFKEREQRV